MIIPFEQITIIKIKNIKDLLPLFVEFLAESLFFFEMLFKVFESLANIIDICDLFIQQIVQMVNVIVNIRLRLVYLREQ